ncbi:MAG: DUF4445 domain-containing protein [Clostridiales bacterium]|nr:DUF4445 domain-containing protein [Clostridiales bacterium]
MFQVIFRLEAGDEVKIFAQENENLLEVARKANVAIDAPCSGNVSCGKCKVRLVEGQLDSPKTRHISDEDYAEGWRLSCASRVIGDVTVMVPDIASAYKSRMKTADLSSGEEIALFESIKNEINAAGIPFDNDFVAVDVSMDEPTLDDTMPDNERLSNAIMANIDCEGVKISYAVMRKLPGMLRENNFSVRCAGILEDGYFRLMNVMPVDTEYPLCALAIDIGTTTVTGVLFDLETGKLLSKGSTGNGQIRYGADVINRIIESQKPGGKKRLQDAIIKDTLQPLIRTMCRDAKMDGDRILRVCIAANTTMNHLFVGTDADPIRMEPYIPAFFDWRDLKAGDLNLPVHHDARIILAPNLGSYVGGDITAGTLTSMIWNSEEMSLFIDLGTNGELVFGNSDFLMSCACSAGPAFEGGDISCGMRATDGAIEACTIDKETMEPTLTIIGDADQKAVGMCGSGIIDVISELFRCGIINAKGLFIREGKRVSKDANGFDCYVLAFADESATERNITINNVDIDNFIRAKGAIFSAICTMLNSLDMDVSCIEQIYVAGGIGSGINMRNAVNIGMFPDVEIERFHYIGNSSLTGAYAMALSGHAEEKVYELAQSMTYLELSTTPGYMDEFVAACFLPHTNASLFPSCNQD